MHKRRIDGTWWVGLALLMAGANRCEATEPQATRYRFEQVHMGVPVELILYAPDEPTANRAADAAFGRIKQLNDLLSDYDPQSELSCLSDTAGSGRAVPVGPDLWYVLSRAKVLSERTEGAFDVTVGPIVKLWRGARRSKRMPSPERIQAALDAVGYRNVELDDARHTVKLLRPGMRLDLGGIAMGYAADEMLKVLRQHGVTRALIDASGDILAGDPPPDANGWRIGIVPLESKAGPPSKFLSLANAAVTTSGDAYQHVVIDGQRYSHIVDPKTGLGLTTPSSVTVVASDCITADSLATAVSVLGPEKGLKLVEETPSAAAVVMRHEENGMKTFESKRLAFFVVTKD